MSRTDKDQPFRVRQDRGEYGVNGNYWCPDSGFRKGRKALKRQGNKAARRGKTRFWDVKTVRTAIYYY